MRSTQQKDPTTEVVKNYADTIVELPSGEFMLADVDKSFKWHVQKLYAHDILVRVDKIIPGDEYASNGPTVIWRVHSQARALAETAVENQFSPCPCGHAGLINHGEYIECKFDGCDREFSKSEVEL